LDVSEFELSKVIADAICVSFKANNNMFADFNTMGIDVAKIITTRFDHIERNPKAYKQYFEIEQSSFNFNSRIRITKKKGVISG